MFSFPPDWLESRPDFVFKFTILVMVPMLMSLSWDKMMFSSLITCIIEGAILPSLKYLI